MTMSFRISFAFASALAFGSRVAAQPTPPTPSIAASQASAIGAAQFDKGRAYMKSGNYAAACAAFEHSERLDPQLGTLYNLAGCYVRLRKLVSAWTSYRELAQRDTNSIRREDAAKQVRDLEPRLPKLFVKLDPPIAGATVRSNGVDVSELIGSESPVDLGDYELVARAPGYVEQRASAHVHEEGKTVVVGFALVRQQDQDVETPQARVAFKPAAVVRPVAPAAPAEPEVQASESDGTRSSWTRRRRLAEIAGAGGVTLIAAGLVFGKLATTKWDDVKALCGSALECGNAADLERAETATSQARARGNASTALMIGGVAAVGGAVVLWLTAPSIDASASAWLVPHAGPADVGVALEGRF